MHFDELKRRLDKRRELVEKEYEKDTPEYSAEKKKIHDNALDLFMKSSFIGDMMSIGYTIDTIHVDSKSFGNKQCRPDFFMSGIVGNKKYATVVEIKGCKKGNAVSQLHKCYEILNQRGEYDRINLFMVANDRISEVDPPEF